MIRLMELTMNQANMNLGNANAEWGSTGWKIARVWLSEVRS